jgi:hypothetical protein
MAIELSNLRFTKQDDIVPVFGVEEIVNTGVANTLAGNDRIIGTGDNYGIHNFGTLNTSDGNDVIIGVSHSQEGYLNVYSSGIFHRGGTINTGDGDDKITGTGQTGIILHQGIVDTGTGSDTITGTGQEGEGISISNATVNTGDGDDKITGTSSFASGIALFYGGILDTGTGSDTITGTGGNFGILNNFFFNTGDGNDKITGNSNFAGRGIINIGTMDTGAGNDEITGTSAEGGELYNDLSWGIYNSYGNTIDTGDGKDKITGTGYRYGIYNTGTIHTVDGSDIITGTSTTEGGYGIYHEGIINTGNGDDSIIANGGFHNNGGAINMGDGNDSIISNGGFQASNSSGAWFLGEGDDYIKGFGSGDFYGGNGNDTLELTPGTYTVGIWGEGSESPIFTKGNQLMITSEFEKLKAGSTIYDFTSLTAGQIIVVA